MKHTKKVIAISIDPKLDNIMEELFDNKSKYIEWLIFNDMKKHLPDNKKLNDIIL